MEIWGVASVTLPLHPRRPMSPSSSTMRQALLLMWLTPTLAFTPNSSPKPTSRRAICASFLTALAAIPMVEPAAAAHRAPSENLWRISSDAKFNMEQRLVKLARANTPVVSRSSSDVDGGLLAQSKGQRSSLECTEAVQHSAEAVLNDSNLYTWGHEQLECGPDYRELMFNSKVVI